MGVATHSFPPAAIAGLGAVLRGVNAALLGLMLLKPMPAIIIAIANMIASSYDIYTIKYAACAMIAHMACDVIGNDHSTHTVSVRRKVMCILQLYLSNARLNPIYSCEPIRGQAVLAQLPTNVLCNHT